MKFLIIGLGNIGAEYAQTRHNIGFDIAEALVKKHLGNFSVQKHAQYAQVSLRGRQIHVIMPTTYMNLSGKAVRHWMTDLNIPIENIFILVDDLAIDYGKLRIRANGSDAGHNGLKSINELLGAQNYPRLRFGIGNNFPKGRQVDYVLGKWTTDEMKEMPFLIHKSVDAIESFVIKGLPLTMNEFNK